MLAPHNGTADITTSPRAGPASYLYTVGRCASSPYRTGTTARGQLMKPKAKESQ
jgi:hypothetical protein